MCVTLAKCFVYLLNVSADSAFILPCMCLFCMAFYGYGYGCSMVSVHDTGVFLYWYGRIRLRI